MKGRIQALFRVQAHLSGSNRARIFDNGVTFDDNHVTDGISGGRRLDASHIRFRKIFKRCLSLQWRDCEIFSAATTLLRVISQFYDLKTRPLSEMVPCTPAIQIATHISATSPELATIVTVCVDKGRSNVLTAVRRHLIAKADLDHKNSDQNAKVRPKCIQQSRFRETRAAMNSMQRGDTDFEVDSQCCRLSK